MGHSSKSTFLLPTTFMIAAALFCGPTDGRVCFDFGVVKGPTDYVDMTIDAREMQCDSAFDIGEIAAADYCDFEARDAAFDHCAYSSVAIYDKEGNVTSVLFEGGCYYDRTYNYCKKLIQTLNSSVDGMKEEFCDICLTDNCNSPNNIPRNKQNLEQHLKGSPEAKKAFIKSYGSQYSINLGTKENFENLNQRQHEVSEPKEEMRSYGKKRALLSIVSFASLLFVATIV